MKDELDREKLKQIAVNGAFDWLGNHFDMNGSLRVGVGSGSTVSYSFDRFAEYGDLTAVPTSENTRAELEKRGVQVDQLKESDGLAFDLDGADEVDPDLNLIKGGGGCHYREKKVAKRSECLLIVVDETKLVEYLGQTFPLPVEVKPDKLDRVSERLTVYGDPEIRRANEEPFSTDNGNFIIDVQLEGNPAGWDPEVREKEINGISGVLENGFFAARRADLVFVGTEKGPEIIGDEEFNE